MRNLSGAVAVSTMNSRRIGTLYGRKSKQWLGEVDGLILGVAIVVIGGSIWYFRHGHQDAPAYQTVAVTRGELTQVVTATGTLNPVVNVTVGSQVSGRISKLYVDYNSAVKSNAGHCGN